jgi:ABC-type multidrug transport system ATPase subunit
VRIGFLDQSYSGLEEVADDMVREVLGSLKTQFQVEGRDLSPAQMLERLGFSTDHLSTRVSQLSGGQRRRLQILLILCQEPNVLILDEPTNDVDTDMLTALEDLLDGWPGTVIVVSHDRYFVERVTDQQYAIVGGRLRHLPGGVDEYLAISARDEKPAPPPTAPVSASGAQRALRKQLATIEARLAKGEALIADLARQMAAADPTDWAGLHALGQKIDETKAGQAALEDEWLRTADALDQT